MANQLLATFYVQSPEFLYGNVPVAARILYQNGNNWQENANELSTTVTPAHYNESGKQRYRYKIDVFRADVYEGNSGQYYYPLHKAGTYKRKLEIKFNNSFLLERVVYITIQPDLHVYRDGTDLVHTEEKLVSQNPLVKNKTVILDHTAAALSARNINLTDLNNYKSTVFVKSNLPVDSYNTDFSLESSVNGTATWLRLKEKIRMTRKIGNTEYQWSDGYGNYPIINTDAQGKYVHFIDANQNGNNTPLLNHPYYGAVELGLEKPFLDLPISIESDLRFYARGVLQYTGTGETTTTTAPVDLPLHAILKTAHAVKILPSVITLNEDNNYTAFIAVEANDGANWTFVNIDNCITVTPSSGTGRAAVVIKKADSFNLTGNFINVPLTITSTVNAATYPNIEGEYEASDTAAVHLEQYTPEHNALIPRMESNAAEGVTIASIQADRADELNADFAYNADHVSFAITSVDDILNIDTGTEVVLDKIELFGTNIRRTIETNIGKGGAAVSFSLLGANDINGTWTTLRNGSALTDFAAVTGSTTVGNWQSGSKQTVTLTNTGTAAFRYYKLVPDHRSTEQDMSLSLHKLNLYKKVNAVQVGTTGAVVTDSLNTPATTLNTLVDTSIQTVAYYAITTNNKTYHLQIDFGTANKKKIDLIQITGYSSSNDDSLAQGFTISASDDAVTWTPLLTTDEPLGTASNQTRSFDIPAAQTYRYYRIDFAHQADGITFYMNKMRLFTKTGTQKVSCLLPKCPHINSPVKRECNVKITSAAVCGLPSAVSKTFEHSLSMHGFAGRFTTGLYSDRNVLATNTGTLSPFAIKNLEKYPAVEVTFETAHRIRSWSLQAVGTVVADAVFESLATVLVRTLDGQWHVLDIARTANENINGNEVSELYTSAKKRLDRPVQNLELVDKIRITAVAVQWQTLAYMGFVWFPQIQVFAGVPVIPKLIQDYSGGSQDTNNIHVRSNGGTEYDDYSYTERDAGERVFDREVAGNNIARIGSRAWYINNNHFLLEDVAENGNISQFGAYQSKAWHVECWTSEYEGSASVWDRICGAEDGLRGVGRWNNELLCGVLLCNLFADRR